ALDRVVKVCLAKDPDERWQSAHDIANELKWIAEGSSAGSPAPTTVVSLRRSRERLAWVLAASFLVAAVAALASLWRRPATDPHPVRLSLEMPAGAPFESFDHATLSPDGRRLAFFAHAANGQTSIRIPPI